MQQIEKRMPDWDPFADHGPGGQLEVYDDMRAHCPVAYSDRLQWSILRHGDVLRVITDHETFSNNVSRYLTVPNGMDPPEHATYRAIVASYFSEERIEQFEPVCRAIVAHLATEALAKERIELIHDFALDVSVRIHCAFLGWPSTLREQLASWTKRSSEAARANDQDALAEVAAEFQTMVSDRLAHRRAIEAAPGHDITAELMHESVFDRTLDDAEIASILRNWTVGEIGTMSASIGILVHFLAEHPDVQRQLRADPAVLSRATDEILRIHGPLVTNRRITTCPVEIGGRAIGTGERVTVNWVSANRDEDVFENATTFSLDRDPSKNLLWGAGIHICPGAPLARMELRVVMEELFDRTTWFELEPDAPPTLAAYPASGFETLPVRMQLPLG